MEIKDKRYLVVILLLFMTSLVYFKFGYEKYVPNVNANYLKSFPLDVGEWSGNTVVLEENVYKILETDMVIVNQYTRGRDSVLFSVVYYPELKVEFHPPEGCQTGRGNTIEELGSQDLHVNVNGRSRSIKVNAFLVKKEDGRSEFVCYFFKSGKFAGNNYVKLRMNMAKDYLNTKKTNGAMLIFSTPVIKNMEGAFEKINDFINSIYPAIDTYF